MSCAVSSKLAAPPKAWIRSKKIILTGMMLISILSVGACGKKPPHVDPPSDDAPKFPAIYPDPKSEQ